MLELGCHKMENKKWGWGHKLVCRITPFNDKQLISNSARKLKGTNIYVYEDFLQEIVELIKSLWEQILKNWRQEKFTCVKHHPEEQFW